MAQLHAPMYVATVVLMLIAPRHHAFGFDPDRACPQTLASLVANEAFDLERRNVSVCEDGLSPWTVRCEPYCGSQLAQHIYVYVVINVSCCSQSVVINTTAFSEEKGVESKKITQAGPLCSGLRYWISDLFEIPGTFCGANDFTPNLTVTLSDCGSYRPCCQESEVHVIQVTDHVEK